MQRVELVNSVDEGQLAHPNVHVEAGVCHQVIPSGDDDVTTEEYVTSMSEGVDCTTGKLDCSALNYVNVQS